MGATFSVQFPTAARLTAAPLKGARLHAAVSPEIVAIIKDW